MTRKTFTVLIAGLATTPAAMAQEADLNQGNGHATHPAQACTHNHAHVPQEDVAAPGNFEAPIVMNHDHGHTHVEQDDLAQLVAESADVFEAVLVDAQLVDVPGMKVLTTEYTFEVTEWFQGEAALQTIKYRETGGFRADGSGMGSCQSHRLTVGGRYLVFGRNAPQEMVLPFNRILQVRDNGQTIVDEEGRTAIGMDGSRLVFADDQSHGTLRYFQDAPELENQVTEMGPPDVSSTLVPEQPGSDALAGKALAPATILDAVRNVSLAESPAAGATFPASVIAEPSDAETRWSWCGYSNGRRNFYGWFPGDNEWNWFQSAGGDWNNVVDHDNGPHWLVGHYGVRNRNPGANNGDNEAGHPSSTQMILGGYGSWSANGSPNGIMFGWWTGNCGRYTETDAFVNPSNVGNELQYRKTMVHELGHALSLNHVASTYGIMVSGTWRVPPNYIMSAPYLRLDDMSGVRAMIDWVNANLSGTTFWKDYWRDIATYSQTESGNTYYMTTLSDYSVNSGDSVQINRMHVENRGLWSMSNVGIKVYLSTNTTISEFDTQVYSGSWSSFGASSAWYNGSLTLNIPSTLPTGNYYVGWILDYGGTELTTSNNTGILRFSSGSGFSPRTISVNCPTPSTPSGVSATDGTWCSGINLAWNSVGGANSYRIYRNTSPSSVGRVQIATDTASPYFDSSVTPGQTYYYWVRANNGCSSTSNYSSYNSGYRRSVPATPSGLTASDGTVCGWVDLDWNSVSGATSYSVYRSIIPSVGTASFVGSTATSDFEDSSGIPGQLYYYWVRANNGCGAGSFSFANSGYYNDSFADLTTVNAPVGHPLHGVPDGQVTTIDLQYYTNLWFNQLRGADLTTQGAGPGDPGYGVPDGTVTSSDLSYYVNEWLDGCN